MKALTIWQPWASLIVSGVKAIETRSWRALYRGPLAIHAAARVHDPRGEALPRACVLGAVELIDCLEIPRLSSADLRLWLTEHSANAEELALGDYRPGRYAWVLRHPRRYFETWPARGQQGFWDWTP